MPRDYIAAVWRAYKADKLSAQDMLDLQREVMPRCACGASATALLEGAPICPECFARRYNLPLPPADFATPLPPRNRRRA